MSTILKAASMAAIALYSIATLTFTDTSAAFASPLTGQPVETRSTSISNPGDSGAPAAAADTAVDTGSATATHIVPGVGPGPVSGGPVSGPVTDSAPYQADSLTQLVAMHDMPNVIDAELNCLAGAVYFESKGESLNGQLAVAKVVIARRDSRRFASSLCGVVYQPRQFSFVRGGRMPNIPTTSRAWAEAVAIAQIALNDSWDSPVEGALFFHARHVSPGWRLQRLAQVDNHIFYR